MNEQELSKDLSNQTLNVLKIKLTFFKRELFNLRFQKVLGELKNTSRFSKVRKNIARINTELSKRVIGE